MKKISSLRLCVLLCAALFLAGCMGGGSGGGGGGGGRGPISSFEPLPVQLEIMTNSTVNGQAKNLAEVSPGTASGLIAPDPAGRINGFQIAYKDYTFFGEDLVFMDGGDVRITELGGAYTVTHPGGPPLIFQPADFTIFDNGLVGMIMVDPADSWSDSGPGYDYNLQQTSAILFGGNKVGLDYTDFGYWEHRVNINGYYNGQYMEIAQNTVEPFILVSNTAVELPAPATGNFTGTVLASARIDGVNDAKPAYLVGDATLNLLAANAGTLALDFANFYTLTTSLNINGTGFITQNGAFTVNPNGVNTTGVTLTNGGTGQVGGQFFGGGADSAGTEAVGGFEYLSPWAAGSRGIISGAFGVK